MCTHRLGKKTAPPNLYDRLEVSIRSMSGLKGRKIFSLVSGGVDSSVATAMALEAGLDVTAATMLIHPGASSEAAEALCAGLGISLEIFDLTAEFEDIILKPFKDAYKNGRTPNPCVTCNRLVKFGLLWDMIAKRYGEGDFSVITGHYARVETTNRETTLCKGVDTRKDQSYFLCMLPIQRVNRLLLPLGAFIKSEVREIASYLGEKNAKNRVLSHLSQKPESMDICFLSSGNYRKSIFSGKCPGDIVDAEGNILGRHFGVENFTIGQRKGLGISSKEPMFVTDILPGENKIVASCRKSAETRTITASAVNVLSEKAFIDGARLAGKIRSQSPASACTISINDRNGQCEVTALFDEPQFAPAPGQYLALYDGDVLVAGGEIVRPFRTRF